MVITIDSTNRTSSVVTGSLSITNKINNKADTCKFRVRKYGSKTYKPSVGDEVSITDGGTTIFGGYIIRINESIQVNQVLTYDVECIDYSFHLRRRLVTERYENKTVAFIIDDLLTTYASGDGFTDTNVSVSATFSSISFNNINIPECLDKMADSLNAFWYVDYNQDIHFFQKSQELAPFDLTDTSNNYIYNSLEIEEDLTQLRNRITVRGGTIRSDTDRTQTFVSQDNAQDVFELGYRYATTPVVKVNSVAQTVGTEYLDDDASFDCMWSFNEKYIRFTSGNIPSLNDEITVEGKILIPIVVRTPNNSSIAEYGVYEFSIKDNTISSQDEAIDRAIAELKHYANELNEGSFKTYNSGLRAGQVLNINSTLRNKNINVLIQSVQTTMRDSTGDSLEYKVKFATLKSLSIISFLQSQIRDEDVRADEQETILNFFEFADSFSMSDTLSAPTTSSPPYKWSNDAETTPNRMIWNKFTWS